MLNKLFKNLKNYLKSHLKQQYLRVALLLILVFSLGVATGYYCKEGGQSGLISIRKNIKSEVAAPTRQDVESQKEDQSESEIYVEFLSEVYDKIKEYYWDKITDEKLCDLFKRGSEKLTGAPQLLSSNSKDALRVMLAEIIQALNGTEQKKEFSAHLANIVLVNLEPLGRSKIFTTQQREDLVNNIQNINPETNLYETLEVEKGASEDEIKESFDKKSSDLEQESTPEAKKELKDLKYAYEVLSDTQNKEKYDTFGAEPTVLAKLVRPDIFHIYIQKFSPTTLEEFIKAADSVDGVEDLDTLILDLRSNIGGAITILPQFLGPFIGKNQYAFEFFHQGKTIPYKTPTGWLASLVRYKKVVILVDSQTQSTAELMAATLKKYNAGVLVGTTTKGWGTVEKVIELNIQIDPEEKYFVYIVSNLTIRDDGQPVEGKGVEPLISINNPDWEKQLFAYFHYDELTKAVKEIWNKSPDDFY